MAKPTISKRDAHTIMRVMVRLAVIIEREKNLDDRYAMCRTFGALDYLIFEESGCGELGA